MELNILKTEHMTDIGFQARKLLHHHLDYFLGQYRVDDNLVLARQHLQLQLHPHHVHLVGQQVGLASHDAVHLVHLQVLLKGRVACERVHYFEETVYEIQYDRARTMTLFAVL